MRKPFHNHFLAFLFLSSLILFIGLGKLFSTPSLAQSVEPSQLVQQGVEAYQGGDYQKAIKDWQTALNIYKSAKNPFNIAIVSENLARTYQQLGNASTAISYWQKALNNYQETGNLQKVGRTLTEQAQSYAALGQYRNSINLLCGTVSDVLDPTTICLPNSALEIAREQKDQMGEIAALGSLGEAYRAIGQYPQSISILEKANQISDASYQSAIDNSLGNTYTKQANRLLIQANSALLRGSNQGYTFKKLADQNYQKAQSFLKKSIQSARQQNHTTGQLKALLNFIQLGENAPSIERTEAIQESLQLLETLPNSPDKIYGAITLANLPTNGIPLTEPLAQCPDSRRLSQTDAENLLKSTEQNAKPLESRTYSFALGALGHFYECNQDYAQALEYTQKAIWSADQNQANLDSLYLWEWQIGRIRELQGEIEPAIAFYQNAVTSLEKIRSDILSTERDVQFDFRDQIEPVYRQLAKLRLKKASQKTLSLPQKEQELTQSLDTIDRLRLAELQNYLGNDCFLGETQIIEKTERNNPNTAIFNSIILEQETAIIVSLPNGEKKIHWIFQPRPQVVNTISRFRQGLIEGRLAIDDYDLSQAKILYDWLIRPFETDLQAQSINTLVFIQDGLFRTIPMSALHNGEQFLIEKYAIAMTTSLSLVLPESEQNLKERALILGVTKPTVVDQQNFEKLTNVPLEVAQVQLEFVNHKLLLDEAFNRENLDKELNKADYKIVHIATHAQFGTISDDTFLVIGNNSKLTIKELEKALRQLSSDSKSVDLLVLTACQTAEGDERSSLGLAGVAVQAGVKSVLASLWSIPDNSTLELITAFYQNLAQPNVSKAEALRTAQIALIKAKQNDKINDQYDNPAYWAPFILLGNWL